MAALKRTINGYNNDEEARRIRKRQRQSRCVVFAEEPTTIEFEKLDQVTKKDVWYTNEDFQTFQFERILNVHCLQRVVAGDKTPLDPNLVCFRGLEHYRSEQRRKKFLLGRQNHIAAILEEQDRQRAEGDEDPEAFPIIAEVATRNMLRIAQYQALIDQHEAGLKKIAQKTKKNKNSTPLEDSPVHTPTPQQVAVRAA